MQQNITTKIREYLPEINVNELNFDTDKNEQIHAKHLDHFTENIQNWSHAILEKAKLPTTANEANALTTKYSLDTNEGCALRIVVELDSLNKSVAIQDASTAALASMKLLEVVWHSSLFRNAERNSRKEAAKSGATATPRDSAVQASKGDNINLYQNTINDLKDKYPHCNVNALRLLAATRLNVSKQELDDLNITPQ